MVFCKFKEANEDNVELSQHTSFTFSIHAKYPISSDTSGFVPHRLIYTVAQLCINKNDHFDLCTTGPTHMYYKLNKYKYMWEIYNDKHITDSQHILYIYSEVYVLKIRVHFHKNTGIAMMIGKTKVLVGPVVHKSILRFIHKWTKPHLLSI